jgi:two-component sensor histidine kinase
LSSLRADEFSERLATLLAESYGEYGMRISGQGDAFYIKVEKAVPIGIFVSEACANAVKHARPAQDEPLSIRISMRLEDGFVLVEVRDDGKGFGPDGEAVLGMGSTLMAAVAEQAGGALKRRDEGGAVVWFTYPAD